MSKALIVDAIAAKTGISKAQAGDAFDAVVDAVTSAAAKGERLQVPGLFTLTVKDQPAKTGRNPATGAEIKIPARKAVKIQPATALKAAANK